MRTVDTPCRIELFRDVVQHLMQTPTYRQSFWASTWTLIDRQMTITLRNKKFLRARALMVVLGGLIYGTTFFQVDLANVQVTLGIVYQTAIFLSVGQASEIPAFVAAREIYYKQRRANFYRTSSFVIAYLAAAAPVIIGESIVFGSLVYWMCGFVAEIGPFVVFLLGMMLSSMALSSSFVVLSALSANLDVAQPVSTLSNVLFSVFAGFVVPMGQIPGYFSWLYWVNPVAWCLRAVIVSQYRSSSFDVCIDSGENYCERFNSTLGEYLLSQYDVPSKEEWVWGGMAYLVLAILVFVAAGTHFLEHKRFDQARREQRLATRGSVAHAVRYWGDPRPSVASTSESKSSNAKRSPKKKERKLHLQLEQQGSNALAAAEAWW
ncbi:hypothetical protein PHYPSEUDO_005032 [Phytophthora pseudosyringae]|uniref:ABC-2 type transporter transmembrane domain-containing protein n=1 Tax=Phytophthora pseudosyringae TaxID=221518 RepID=A0A8T1VSC8_9STRA|nr:hypothetical protein PHYPSEUDO_005032 [Phytophthora pseudosyringae]